MSVQASGTDAPGGARRIIANLYAMPSTVLALRVGSCQLPGPCPCPMPRAACGRVSSIYRYRTSHTCGLSRLRSNLRFGLFGFALFARLAAFFVSLIFCVVAFPHDTDPIGTRGFPVPGRRVTRRDARAVSRAETRERATREPRRESETRDRRTPAAPRAFVT